MENSQKAFLAYLFGGLSGAILYISTKDKFLKFHGLQSILFSIMSFFIAIFCLVLIFIAGILSWFFGGILLIFTPVIILIALTVVIAWLVLMHKAYQGEKYKMIFIGNIAERFTK